MSEDFKTLTWLVAELQYKLSQDELLLQMTTAIAQNALVIASKGENNEGL